MGEDDGEGVANIVMEFDGAMGGFHLKIWESVSDGKPRHVFMCSLFFPFSVK